MSYGFHGMMIGDWKDVITSAGTVQVGRWVDSSHRRENGRCVKLGEHVVRRLGKDSRQWKVQIEVK